jgi:hypothetical protein
VEEAFSEHVHRPGAFRERLTARVLVREVLDEAKLSI